MGWVVYRLESVTTGQGYISVSTNHEYRQLEHNGVVPVGAARTRNDGGPFTVLQVRRGFGFKSLAMAYESAAQRHALRHGYDDAFESLDSAQFFSRARSIYGRLSERRQ
jgi:predicted GIY-YIG superfamily endonuclease